MSAQPAKRTNNPLVNHFLGHLRKKKRHVTFSMMHENTAEVPAKF